MKKLSALVLSLILAAGLLALSFMGFSGFKVFG